MLERPGWSRSRARDYYDPWRVLGTYRDRMDMLNFGLPLRDKCAVRGIAFAGPEDFFHGGILAYVKETWEQWLGPLVPVLPVFDTIAGALRLQVETILS